MRREFLRKVVNLGVVYTRKHAYKRIFERGLIKVIRDDVEVVAVYAC